MTVVALEIGPTRFAAIEIADEVGPEQLRQIPIPERQAWERVRDLVLEVAAGRELAAIGIASAGPIDMSSGVVAPAHVRDWQAGFSLVDSVQELFPGAQVAMTLDGVCLSLAERHFGGAREVMDSLSIYISETIIGGAMVGGFVVVGRTGNAGQVGHVLVPGYDDPCTCGGRGCLEAVAGGIAMVRWANEKGWPGASVDALVAAAQSGEPVAVGALERAGTALGRAIASVAALLDIDRVVVGGVVAAKGSALWKPLQNAVAMHARLPSLSGLRVVPSELGDLGLLAGAGVLALSTRQQQQG
ncbi:ROK family protein [Nocardia flavorosea]|uniref:ROK family protein n=1 Tax=Nocardia flavorosea TaxID=53429 RepID=A0A846YRX5_9NOCA|nr:ROK family protein [Nocardia flavorosea]NKY60300.1 ROK family protein [Nocardia flavorosea]